MTNPLSLYFQREGDITGPTFVILHGLFGSTPNFTTLAKALAQYFDVIRIDLRNHGRSAHADTMCYRDMAADVENTLAAMDVSSAIVLGHSMGGKVAMQLAVDYPDRVDTLIVADIAPKQYADNSHDTVLTAMSSLPMNAISTRKEADAHLQTYLDEAMLRQFLLTNLVRDADGFKWRINLLAICENYTNIAAAPVLLAAYDKPSMFICGGASDYIQLADRAAIEHVFPRCEWVTIDGAGHWLHAERPQEFLAAIKGFLNV